MSSISNSNVYLAFLPHIRRQSKSIAQLSISLLSYQLLGVMEVPKRAFLERPQPRGDDDHENAAFQAETKYAKSTLGRIAGLLILFGQGLGEATADF